MYEIGWAELKGTGIRAMQQAVDELNLTPPTFESAPQDRAFCVTFYRHHFVDSADLAWLERYSDLGLSTEEQKALVYALIETDTPHTTLRVLLTQGPNSLDS